MAKHIGIVACSAEGAALCYRTICAKAQVVMGEHIHPEISMHNYALEKYMVHVRAGDWQEVGQLMLSSCRKLIQIGADFAICPDNTIHEAFDFVKAESPIPWLHIADVVGQEAQLKGFKRIGITGTKYLMTGPVYPKALEKLGILYEIPGSDDRERIDDIIFQQLVSGVIKEESRLYFNMVIQKFKDQGCDAAVLGCTEIPLLVDPGDCPLPVLDSTRLLARAALEKALS